MKQIKHLALLVLSIVFSFSFSYSQSNDLYELVHPVNLPESHTKIDCEKLKAGGCNLVQNDEFQVNGTLDPSEITNPFPTGKITNWVETHGTPALTDFITPATVPPTGILNYASMYSWYDDNKKEILGEGIAQKIPYIKKGNNYSISFFKKLA